MVLKKIYFLAILILLQISAFASGNPCPPFSPCWCAQHPGNKSCTAVPINDEIWILLIAGLILGVFYIKKRNKFAKQVN